MKNFGKKIWRVVCWPFGWALRCIRCYYEGLCIGVMVGAGIMLGHWVWPGAWWLLLAFTLGYIVGRLYLDRSNSVQKEAQHNEAANNNAA